MRNNLNHIFEYLNNIDIFLLFKNLVENSNFEVFKYRPSFEPLFFAFINEAFSIFLKKDYLLYGQDLPKQTEMYNQYVQGTNLMHILHKFFEELFKHYEINILTLQNYKENCYVNSILINFRLILT